MAYNNITDISIIRELIELDKVNEFFDDYFHKSVYFNSKVLEYNIHCDLIVLIEQLYVNKHIHYSFRIRIYSLILNNDKENKILGISLIKNEVKELILREV